MKTPIVFSFAREQSVFMTAIMGLMTFLGVLAFGVAISIGTAVVRWNAQWDLIATVQVTKSDNAAVVQKVLNENKSKIASVNEISTDEMNRILRPWVSNGGTALANYMPKMWEVKFTTRDNMRHVADAIAPYGRFLTHADAVKTSVSAGWRMVFIAAIILAMAIGAITICVSYIARNTAMLHRRELEILNQVGATDAFIAKQMQVIVAKICVGAGAIGFIAASIVLCLIIWAARAARVGLMAMIGISGAGWLAIFIATVLIIVFAIWMTRRTTLKILQRN
ncbi:MAG: hypothetical protein IJ560_02420 [Alphaproteobacteria bacterium]|nr:hypothetical protein [Alphaproteobacteria bacterium]